MVQMKRCSTGGQKDAVHASFRVWTLWMWGQWSIWNNCLSQVVMDLELSKTGGSCLGESCLWLGETCLWLQAVGAQHVMKKWIDIQGELWAKKSSSQNEICLCTEKITLIWQNHNLPLSKKIYSILRLVNCILLKLLPNWQKLNKMFRLS